jgi:DNA-binding CsgD family transcriptional regulator
VEAAWALSAEAELCRALGENDPARWGLAAAGWDELERPYEAACARLHQAEALVEHGAREEGERVLADARRSAAELGSIWLVEESDGFAARARLHIEPEREGASAEAARAAGAQVQEDPFGLTPRELEVLRLLASGSTNREIGAKLEVRSRTQAAAVAHRAGLVA